MFVLGLYTPRCGRKLDLEVGRLRNVMENCGVAVGEHEGRCATGKVRLAEWRGGEVFEGWRRSGGEVPLSW